jgi:hypothetical protein
MRSVVLLAALACGGAPASLRLGSGPVGFVPLEDGGALEVHRGPQGGYHVFLAVRAAGVSATPTVDFDVVDLDAGRTLDRFVPLRLPLEVSADAPGFLELSPRVVVLDIASADAIAGHRLRVSARVDGDATSVVAISLPAP